MQANITLDAMTYATDGAAQAVWTATPGTIVVYSEATIKRDTYSMKVVASVTGYIAKDFSSAPVDLSAMCFLQGKIWANRTGSNIKIRLFDDVTEAWIEKNISIQRANSWEVFTWDFRKEDAIPTEMSEMRFEVINADASNTFYLNDFICSVRPYNWLDTFDYKRTIGIDRSLFSADVTGQVMCVNLADIDLSHAQGDYDDVRFTTKDGTSELPFRIVDDLAFVQVDIDRNNSDAWNQTIAMYYGNASADPYGPGDPYYLATNYEEYDTLLLHFDGVNGATTTVDSAKGATVTFRADAQLDTSQHKFGVSALKCDGNNDAVYLPASANYDLVSTASWSVDFWIKLAATPGSWTSCIHCGSTSDPWDGYLVAFNPSGYLSIVRAATGDGGVAANVTLSNSTWYHVAFVHNDAADTLKIYIDGVERGTATASTAITWPATINQPLYIGGTQGNAAQSLNGWLDEMRYTLGVARWTSGFTPPSVSDFMTNIIVGNEKRDQLTIDLMEYSSDALAQAAWVGSDDAYLTIDSYTKTLLNFTGTNGETTTTDEASSPHSYSFHGNAQISTGDYKFSPSSLYCDGDSDYLTTGGSADFLFDGDFTVEMWTKSLTTGAEVRLPLSNMDDSASSGFQLNVWNDKVRFYYGAGGSGYVENSSVNIKDGNWHHVAVVRSGSTLKLYLDGGSGGGSVTYASNIGSSGNTLYVGVNHYCATYGGNEWWYGYIDGFRISKGVARWTGDFTPYSNPYGQQRDMVAYSESSIKEEGSYSLKMLTRATVSDVKCSKTMSNVDFTYFTDVEFYVREATTGINTKMRFVNGAEANIIDYEIDTATINVFEKQTADIEAENRESISRIDFYIINSTTPHYLDEVVAYANKVIIDDFEYASDGLAQAAYVASDASVVCYSEATIKVEGDYALKITASTSALNQTATKTFTAPLNFTGKNTLAGRVRASRTGINFSVFITQGHPSSTTTTYYPVPIAQADTWTFFITDFGIDEEYDRDNVIAFGIKITNADSANTIYLDIFDGRYSPVIDINTPELYDAASVAEDVAFEQVPALDIGIAGSLFTSVSTTENVSKSISQPVQPTNVSPANSAVNQLMAVTLEGSTYSHPYSVAHQRSRWQIRTSSGNYTTPTYDSGWVAGAPISIEIPAGTLLPETVYYWHVSYRDVEMAWSEWSDETSFTTKTLRVGGQVTLNEIGVNSAKVFCIKRSTNAVVGTATTSGGGYYHFSPLQYGETYHLAVEYETGGIKYNALSRWAVEPVETDV